MPKGLSVSKKTAKVWRSRIQESINHYRTNYKNIWEHLIRRYMGEASGTDWSVNGGLLHAPDWVEVNKFFPLVEQKKAQLFYKLPKVQMEADVVLQETFGEQASAIASAVELAVNKQIGLHRMNLLPEIQKALFDVLCPAGLGAIEVGYRTVMETATFEAGEVDPVNPTSMQPRMMVEPVTGQEIPEQDEMGQPVLEEQPNLLEAPFQTEVPVFEEWFYDQFSVDKLVIPVEFKDTDYNKADWLGVRFSMPLTEAKRRYDLPSDFKPTGNPEDKNFEIENAARTMSETTSIVEGIRVWYRASAFDSRIVNPDIFHRLVFINGLDKPAEHVPNPHQELGPDGRLTPTSQKGNPIRVLTIRDISGSAYPPSDSKVIRRLVDELSKGRTQMMRHRDRSLPMNWHDRNRVSRDDILKWSKGIIGASLPVDGDGSTAFGEIKRAQLRPENFQFDSTINRDIDEVSSMGANQRGVETAEKKSATEQSIVDKKSDIRLDAERDRVLSWFLRSLTQSLIPLLFRYTTPEGWAALVGQERAQLITGFLEANLDVSTAFTIFPDSGAHFDAQVRLANLRDIYEFVAKDPNVNRVPILREMLAVSGLDPAEILVTEPPEPKPEPPSFSARITAGEDLNPMNPQFDIVRSILEQFGVQIPDDAVSTGLQKGQLLGALEQLVQAEQDQQQQLTAGSGPPEHGGLASKVDPLSKNSADQTGGTSGLPGEGT